MSPIDITMNVLIKTKHTPKAAIGCAPIVVTNNGAVVKNVFGSRVPGIDLGCELKAMHSRGGVVELYFEEGDCCDMESAVALAECVIPVVHTVQTYSGNKPDTVYRKSEQGWTVERIIDKPTS